MRGAGKPGFCKVCAFEHEPEINQKLKAGYNAARINEYTQDKWGFSANRQTWYSHKKHITAPEDKVVSLVARKKSEMPVIRKTTNRQFLEAVRDLGMTRAMDNPEEISIDHALKATQILENSREKSGDITLILARVVMDRMSPADVIVEGEVVEVG